MVPHTTIALVELLCCIQCFMLYSMYYHRIVLGNRVTIIDRHIHALMSLCALWLR